MLPTFFVIGAAKSGTTALHEYLGAHPQIEMTARKEVHLFLGETWRERVNGYDELFAGTAAQIRGDASPGYSVAPNHGDTPDRIAELVPDARLIYMVRDPVERTIVHYAQHVLHRGETRPIGEALKDPRVDYLNASFYARQAENYLRVFDRDRLLIVEQRDLRDRRRETLSEVFGFLGADPSFWLDAFELEHNTRAVDNVVLPGGLERLRRSRLNRLSQRVVPLAARRRVTWALRRRIGRTVEPEVPDEVRAWIAEQLADDAARFREIAGRPFADWPI